MDPLGLSFLEGMDQVEVVIDSEEEANVISDKEDSSTDEVEEQDDDADVTYVPEDFAETSSNDGVVEIQDDEAESSGTEDVPPKKLKISNVISLSSNSKSSAKNSLPSLEMRHNIPTVVSSNGKSMPGPRTYKANIKHIISKKAPSSNITTGSTINPPQASILMNVLTNENQNTPVANTGLPQNGMLASMATSTPAAMPLDVPGSSNVHSNVIQAAVNTSSGLQNLVLVPNQQQFVLEEDHTRINPCFVPGCKIYKNEQMYAFGVPKIEATRKVWNLCINNNEQKLDFNHVICYKHFAQEDVIHNIKVVLQHGQNVALDEPRLRKGALPCVKFSETCCVPNCNKTSGRMYSFPVTNKANLHLWLYLIRNIELKKLSLKDLMKYRVCEVHFEADSFDKDKELEKSAAPTLFLPESNALILPQKALPPRKEQHVKTCAFQNCASQRNPKKLMFSFPNTFDRILGWLEACNRVDLIGLTLTETLPKLANVALCEDHFQPSDFENSMMNKLKDSAVPSARLPRVAATEDDSKKRSQSIKLAPVLLESCIYRGCKNKPTKDKPFFFFPADIDRYKEWMKACGYKCFGRHFYAYKICPNHFSNNMFDKTGYLLDSAVPFMHPDPNLIVSPVVHPKKFPNSELSSQKFRSEGRVETVLNFNDQREVVVIQDTRTLDAPEIEEEQGDLICAVRNCMSLYKFSEGENHRFPNPRRDIERFDIWLKLVANNNLLALSKTEICKSYMVCKKHFEKRFYTKRIPNSREKVLSDEAVPTLNLPADSCLLKEWDYYKDRLKKYLDALAAGETNEEGVEDEDQEPVVTSWITTESVRLSDLEDKTRCVLELDRLSFPGMGCNLMMSTSDKKAKFPYSIYRSRPAGYGLTNDIQIGENVHIHTAIIIDDDDESERRLLQQLADRRKKKNYSTES